MFKQSVIFPFRCQRAQQLFNLLQSYVRQPATDHSSHPTTAGHSVRHSSIDIDQDRDRLANPEHNFETQTSLQENVLQAGPHYINVNCPSTNGLNVDCPMPSVPPPSLPLANGSDIAILEGHEYVNVTLQSPGMSQVIKFMGVCRNFHGGGCKTN